MATLKTILQALRQYPTAIKYMESLGFRSDDSVSPVVSNPAIGDYPGDGQISFHIEGSGRSGYILITDENSIQFFDEAHTPIGFGMFAKDISRWAHKIDPSGPARKSGKLPRGIKRIEERERREGVRGLYKMTGHRPRGKRFTSAFGELTRLPAEHPAKDLMDHTLKSMGELDPKLVKRQREKYRSGMFGTSDTLMMPIIKYITPIQNIISGMKSTKAYFEAGHILWKDFPHIREKNPVKILYPAAGKNVGAISTAMAIIDNGGKGVEMIFTEIDEDAPKDAQKILKQWMEKNPYLKGDIEPKSLPAKEGGKRLQYRLLYKGKPITLTYTINDGSDGLYFYKTDIMDADVVIVHDPFSDLGKPDALLLTQILPNLPTDQDNPTAILITNELDRYTQPDDYGALDSVIPARGHRIDSGFGCAHSYPQKDIVLALPGWGELGQYDYKSAMILSTDNPLIRMLKSEEDVNIFIFLAELAGGAVDIGTQDPGATFSYGEERLEERAVTKTLPMQTDPMRILSWVSSKIKGLKGDDRTFLSLITVRFLAMQIREIEESQTFPKSMHVRDKIGETKTLSIEEIAGRIVATMPERLIRDITTALEKSGIAEINEKRKLIKLLASLTKDETGLRILDEALMKLQQI